MELSQIRNIGKGESMRLKKKRVRLKELQKLGIADKKGVVNYAKYSKYKSIQRGYGYDVVMIIY